MRHNILVANAKQLYLYDDEIECTMRKYICATLYIDGLSKVTISYRYRDKEHLEIKYDFTDNCGSYYKDVIDVVQIDVVAIGMLKTIYIELRKHFIRADVQSTIERMLYEKV
jgi:hypothetical protein